MKKKTVKKIIYFLVLFPVILFAGGWIYSNFVMKIDTAEVDRYYDLLAKRAQPSGNLVFTFDVSESDNLQTMADRMKRVMGLGDYRIWAGYGEKDDPPAYITNVAPGAMTITFSRKIGQKREQVNVLIHELSHIYVWAMDKSILKDCDGEKFTDCAGVFLGLGVLMLNGLTDDIFFMPGMEYSTEKKMYGYIKPEQLGYLLARHCAEKGIVRNKVAPFLSPTGRKYFNIGYNYLQRSDKDRRI